MREKWFRTDNWSLTVAKIVGILWIPASFAGACLIAKPHDQQTWISTAIWTAVFIFVGVAVAIVILWANLETPSDI